MKMKLKFNKKIVTRTLIGIAIAGVAAVGCLYMFKGTKQATVYESATKNVAEVRYYMKSAKAGNVDVQFYTGLREANYQRDGKASKATPFAIINVVGDETLAKYKQIDGVVSIGDAQHEITLVQNPYIVSNFAYDIIELIENAPDVNTEVSVTLFLTEDKNAGTTTVLQNAFKPEAITHEEALKVASDALAEDMKGKKFESYVTIENTNVTEGGAYWYIQFVDTEGKSHYCAVAPDGAVVTK